MCGGHTMHLFYKFTTYPTGYSVPQELSTEGETDRWSLYDSTGTENRGDWGRGAE